MKVHETCFTGDWTTTAYKDAHSHHIKDDKLANMITMYNCNRFIAPDRRPKYLIATTSVSFA